MNIYRIVKKFYGGIRFCFYDWISKCIYYWNYGSLLLPVETIVFFVIYPVIKVYFECNKVLFWRKHVMLMILERILFHLCTISSSMVSYINMYMCKKDITVTLLNRHEYRDFYIDCNVCSPCLTVQYSQCLLYFVENEMEKVDCFNHK